MTENRKVAEATASQGEEFALMDREDELQILEELRGAVTEKFIYRTPQGVELSYAGTKWAVRKMAERGEVIRVDGHPKIERCVIAPDDHVLITVIGRRVKVNSESNTETLLEVQVGAARGWIKQRLKDGRIVDDEFWFNKTVSKAVRNVQQALMPQDWKKEMIAFLMKKESGQLQKAPAAAPKKAPSQAAASAHGASAPAPATPAAAKPATPAKAPAASAQKQATPPSAPAVPNTTKSAPGQPPRDAALDVLHQRFEVVLRQASGAGADRAKALGLLKALTGQDAVSKLSKEEITVLGPILSGVAKGGNRLENGVVYDAVTGDQLYPAPEAQAEPQAEPQTVPPSDEGPPPEEPMF